jgi:hypothetical protein
MIEIRIEVPDAQRLVGMLYSVEGLLKTAATVDEYHTVSATYTYTAANKPEPEFLEAVQRVIVRLQEQLGIYDSSRR